MSALLEIHELYARYGDFQALFGISGEVHAGECIAIIGANGAGKTTLMRCLTCLLPMSAGTFYIKGKPYTNASPAEVVCAGISMVPEGRRLFSSLNVEDNLLLGAWTKRPGPWTLKRIYQRFPILEERRYQKINSLSGGQQQLVAIGRALMSNPRLLLCDEISLGLAPIVVRDIYMALAEIQSESMSLMIVEQDIHQAMRVANRLYCMAEGRITLSGTPGDFSHEQITKAYFGSALELQ